MNTHTKFNLKKLLGIYKFTAFKNKLEEFKDSNIFL
jgi:hypothetical protein